MELKELPKRIIFAGGGYISFECAHIAARTGCEVIIIHRGDRVLKMFDSDLVDMLVREPKGPLLQYESWYSSRKINSGYAA